MSFGPKIGLIEPIPRSYQLLAKILNEEISFDSCMDSPSTSQIAFDIKYVTFNRDKVVCEYEVADPPKFIQDQILKMAGLPCVKWLHPTLNNIPARTILKKRDSLSG